MKRLLAVFFVLLLLTANGCDQAEKLAPQSPAKEAGADTTLRVAVSAMISPEKTRIHYEQLLNLIANRLGRKLEIIPAGDYANTNKLVQEMKVDMAFVCSGAYVDGKKEFGMELLVVPVAGGEKVYHSYIIAAKDNEFVNFDQLRGSRFAFTDPQSNTGCLVPNYMLARRGETADSFFRERIYTYSHDKSVEAVAKGEVEAAAVDSLVWEFMDAFDPYHTSRTRIVEKSPPYGMPPLVVHPDLDPQLKKQLQALLLGLHKFPAAVDPLRMTRIDRFDTISDTAYDSIREMQTWVEKNKE